MRSSPPPISTHKILLIAERQPSMLAALPEKCLVLITICMSTREKNQLRLTCGTTTVSMLYVWSWVITPVSGKRSDNLILTTTNSRLPFVNCFIFRKAKLFFHNRSTSISRLYDNHWTEPPWSHPLVCGLVYENTSLHYWSNLVFSEQEVTVLGQESGTGEDVLKKDAVW